MTDMPPWLKELLRASLVHLPPRYTGSIQLNCVDGGIGNVSWSQTARPARHEIFLDKRQRLVIAVRQE